MPATGLLLPPGVIQPFDLHRLHDDLHVMAFFENHPVYEAVEAMIRRRSAGPAAIRTILTRHDQSQVDHVNDDGLLAAARFTQRQTCRREIALVESMMPGGCPRARLEFLSHDGRVVALDVASAACPSPARSGLTDPGQHSKGTNLPLMWRGKSARAGAASSVTIDGTAWPIPQALGNDDLALRHGVYTESHDMLILRAGTTRHESVATLPADGQVRRSRGDGATQTVHGRRVGDQWELHRVDVGTNDPKAPTASLVFEEPGRFSLRLEGASDSVDGDVGSDADSIHLLPREPAWARARAVHLRISRADGRVEVTTSIG
jgi:hypothetical protein